MYSPIYQWQCHGQAILMITSKTKSETALLQNNNNVVIYNMTRTWQIKEEERCGRSWHFNKKGCLSFYCDAHWIWYQQTRRSKKVYLHSDSFPIPTSQSELWLKLAFLSSGILSWSSSTICSEQTWLFYSIIHTRHAVVCGVLLSKFFLTEVAVRSKSSFQSRTAEL